MSTCTHATTYDVLVVGAGPGGLATALSAARHGARVLVVDRRPGTSGLPPRHRHQRAHDGDPPDLGGRPRRARARRIRVVPEAASAATLVAPPRSSGRAGGYPSPARDPRGQPGAAAGLPAGPARAGPRRRRAARAAARSGSATRLVGLQRPARRCPCRLRSGHDHRATGGRCTPGSSSAPTARAAPSAPRSASAPRTSGTWAARRPGAVPARPAPLLAASRLPSCSPSSTSRSPAALCPMGAGRWSYVGLRFDGSRPDVPDDWTPTLRAATGLPDLALEVLDVPAVHAGRRGRHHLPGRARASSSATPRTGRPRSPGSA